MCGAPGVIISIPVAAFIVVSTTQLGGRACRPPLLVLHPQCLVSAVSVNMGGALQPPQEVKHWPESGGKDTWSGIGDGEE